MKTFNPGVKQSIISSLLINDILIPLSQNIFGAFKYSLLKCVFSILLLSCITPSSLQSQCNISVVASSNSPVCNREMLLMAATGSGSSWSWQGPGGFMSSDQNPVIDPVSLANDGLYSLTVTDDFGCTATSSVDVTIHPLPQVMTGSYGPLCVNSAPIDLIGLPLSGTGSGTGVWTGSGSGIIGNTFDPMIAGVGSHNVSYTFTDLNTCSNTAQTQIIVNPFATITDQPEDMQVCFNTDATFEVTVAEPNVSYQWQLNSSGTFNDIPGANSSTLTVTNVTMAMNNNVYRVIVTLDNMPDPDCMVISDEAVLKVHSGGALACDDLVHLSVKVDCSTDDVSAAYFLQGHEFFDHYLVMITDLEGNPIEYSNGENLSQYIDQLLIYTITDECSGNYCWGNVIFEDYFEPEIMCNCPVGGEDLDGDGSIDGYAEECTLSCYEYPLFKENYWDRLTDLLIPADISDFIDNNIQDNCKSYDEDDVAYFDSYEDLGCDGALMRRTWILTYDSVNGTPSTISCTQEYYFAPIGMATIDTARIDPISGLIVVAEDSIILPITRVELDCGADISPAGIAAFFDNPLSEDQDTDDDNIDPDEFDIDCVVENNEGIPYAYPHYYIHGRNPSGPHPQAINSEVCNLIVAHSDSEIDACAPGCGSNRKILRTWTILDWCNEEFIQYDQVIKAVDRDPPVIDVPDVTASVDPWKCSADVLLPHPEHLNDTCDDNLTYWIGYVEGDLTITGNAVDGFIVHDVPLDEIITVEYVTEDCCGNRSTDNIQVEVIDLTPPVAITKEFIVLSLSNIGNPEEEDQGIAKLYAIDVDNLSYDGCTDVIVEIRRTEPHCPSFPTDTLFSDHVKFCCGDLMGQAFVEIDVQFRVTDEYGNQNYAWATVRLEDKSIPTTFCPSDIALTCDMDFNNYDLTGLPTSFAACGELDLMCDPNELTDDTSPRRKGPNDGYFNDPRYDGVEIPAYNPQCGYGALRRQFSSCASCVQWIVIEPLEPFNPASITWPSDMIVDCDEYETGEPEWIESVCHLVGLSLTTDTFRFQDGACFKILNQWSIINWCDYDPGNPGAGGKYEHTQVIKIIDTQDPVVTVEDSITLSVADNCFSKGLQLSASATDEGECGSEWLKWEVTIDLYSDWNADYVYSTSLPREVNGKENPFHLPATGNEELAVINLPDGLAANKVWHRVVWNVSDGCGNKSNIIRYFQISDQKDPTPYCLNLSTAVMSGSGTVELWAIDFNVGSFDNCTGLENLIYTFTDVAPPPRNDLEYSSNSDLVWYDGSFWYFDSETGDYKDQDDYFDRDAHKWDPELRSTGKIFSIDDVGTGGMIQIPIYVWDECGNSDFCIVNLRVIDNGGVGEGRIAGTVHTEYGEEIEGVTTVLNSNNPEFPKYDITNEKGEFAFYTIPFFTDYDIRSNKNNDYLNGVSTLDLLLIQKHILGAATLDSPYKMIAADINNDKDISAIDLIELRKLILGIYLELPDNGSWKMVDANQQLSTANPWIYREYLEILDFSKDLLNEDFIGVKLGDVNQSATANMNAPSQDEKRISLDLQFNDRMVEKGEVFEIELKTEAQNLKAYQFTLNTAHLELIDFIAENLTKDNFGLHQNAITVSCSEELAEMDGILFGLKFEAKRSGKISEFLRLSSSITKAEAYTGESLDIADLTLNNKGQNNSDFILYQNQPNPFSDYTVIGFEMPEKDNVTLRFFDVTGKLIKVIEAEAERGYNEIKVENSDFDVNGMIHYKLGSSKYNASKNMFLIE